MRTLIATLALAASASAAAQPRDVDRCRIELARIGGGHYSMLNPFDTQANGTIVLTCDVTNSAPRVLSLSAGHSGNALDRQMRRGSNRLSYNIYVDSAHHVIAGDGTNGTSALVPRAQIQGRFIYPLFGLVPAGQIVEAGEYSDSLRVDVEF